MTFDRTGSTIRRCAPLVLAVGLAAPLAGAQTTWYVDGAFPPGGSGTQAAPFDTIQAGIDAAAVNAGDVVLVAPGIYAERIDFLGKNIRVDSSSVMGGPTIDAGHAGTAVTIGGPDWGNSQVLANFFVKNGNAPRGGGLFVSGASPRIENCEFLGNQALDEGAGAYVENAVTCVFDGCRFEGNGSPQPDTLEGGGLHAVAGTTVRNSIFRQNGAMRGAGAYGDAQFEDCEFLQNVANGTGGAGYAIEAVRCNFLGNRSGDVFAGNGGAVYISTLTDCTVSGNTAMGDGGGAHSSTLTDCAVSNNTAAGPQGALDGLGGGASFSTLTRCVLTNNFAGRGGGTNKGSATESWFEDNFVGSQGYAALDTALSRCVLVGNDVSGTLVEGGSATHCVFWDNEVFAPGSLVKSVVVKNSVLWNTTGPVLGAGVTVTYSNVEGGAPGIGNIDQPALFWMPQGGPAQFGIAPGRDFHLMAGSPCIDAGDPASPLDPDGSIADMGAFPFDPSWFDALPYCEAGVSANGCEASMGWSGIASATAGSGFDLVASGVEGHRLGILIYGIGAAAQTSWTGGPGFLCTTTPTQRMQPVNTGGTLGQCDGEIRTDFNAFLAAKPNALGNPFAPGDTVFAQAWYRNPSTPKTTTLSNGLQFPVGP